ERRTRLAAFARVGDAHVDCAIRGPAGTERLRASWLVACDGAHSDVRHALGLPFPGERVDRRWLLADVDVAAHPAPPADAIRIVAAREGIVALFPLGAARVRLIADLGPAG